VEETKAAVGGI